MTDQTIEDRVAAIEQALEDIRGYIIALYDKTFPGWRSEGEGEDTDEDRRYCPLCRRLRLPGDFRYQQVTKPNCIDCEEAYVREFGDVGLDAWYRAGWDKIKPKKPKGSK